MRRWRLQTNQKHIGPTLHVGPNKRGTDELLEQVSIIWQAEKSITIFLKALKFESKNALVVKTAFSILFRRSQVQNFQHASC